MSQPNGDLPAPRQAEEDEANGAAGVPIIGPVTIKQGQPHAASMPELDLLFEGHREADELKAAIRWLLRLNFKEQYVNEQSLREFADRPIPEAITILAILEGQ